MVRSAGTLFGTLLLAATLSAADVGYVEDFALARDRAAALRQLVPGTEEYYYYHALHALNAERFDQAEALFDPWAKRFGESARLVEVRTRHALLTYPRDPEKSLAYLRHRLGVSYAHQRVTPGAVPNLPTRLDQARLAPAVLLADSLARWPNLDNLEDTALDRLAASDRLDPTRRRLLLQRLPRPDLPNLVPLVAADLAAPDAPAFGSFPIHRLLTLAQLDALVKLRPELRDQSAFVQSYLAKLQPGADDDWRHDRAKLRAYLDRQLAFARTLSPAHNSLKAHLLFQLLTLDRAEGRHDKDLFLEYLRLPRRVPYLATKFAESEAFRHPADLSADFRGLTLLPPVGSDEPLVRAYLEHFFLAADSPKEFEPFVNDVYLRHLFAETKIVNGLGEAERWASDLPPELFRQLKERVDIDFAPTNRTDFGPDDPVRIDLAVKNVPTLIVKVFEINTPNFYRERRRELDTDVNLDGLVPNLERTAAYPEPPLRRVARRFEFPEIAKPGVYVIDFIGAGKSSRALVRKGRLRPLVTTGADGQRVTVVDEKNQVVKDAHVWLGGKEYAPDADGVVTVPFSTAPGRQPVVLRRGEFASLDYLDHQPEQYRLAAGIHVDRESLLARRLATVVVRPGLYLNGSPISVRTLENPRLRLVATDLDGIVTTSEVPNARLFEDRETTHEFRVPPRLASLTVTLLATVKSLVTNQPVEVAASESFALNGAQRTDRIDDLHLARFGADYVLELLGRSGEARPDQPVEVRVKHRDFREPVRFDLKTDAGGRVHLGPLGDVVSVQATAPNGTSHTWPLPLDRATRRNPVHARAGEVVAVPYLAAAGEPSRGEFALFEVVGETVRIPITYTVVRDGRTEAVTSLAGEVRADRFDAIRLGDGQVELHGLAAGDYDLWLKRTGERVRVRVVDGPTAAGYALGSARHLELPRLKPVRIAALTADAESVVVRLADASPFARVHLIATRYVPAYRAFDHLARVRADELNGVYPGHADSVYLTGRNIGDEYRYVLDRKYQRKFPGNMLDRPQVLLNPWAVRTTETGEQVAQEGGVFGGVGAATPPAPAKSAAAGDAAEEFAKLRANPSDPGAYADLDFLADPSAVLTNLVPDKDGVVRVDRKAIGPHSTVVAVAVDPLHTASRSLTLPETPASFLDMRLRAGLDPKGHFAQQKTVSVLPANQPFVLADAAGGRFEAYDTVGKVYALYATLLNHDPRFAEFGFVADWPRLKPEEKRAKYSQFASHELNVFLRFKDPEFFATVVKPYLANKRDKTFVDHWLLGDDLRGYAEPWRYGRLNGAERVLLGRGLPGEGPKTLRFLNDLLRLQPPDPERDRRLFDTGVFGRGLDASNEVLNRQAELQRRAETPLAAAPPPTDAPAPAAEPAAGGAPSGMSGLPGPAGPGGGFGGGRAGRPRSAGGKAMEQAARDGDVRKQDEAKKEAAQVPADRLDQLHREEYERAAKDQRDKSAGSLFFGERAKGKYAALYRKVEPTKEWAENNYHHLPIGQQGPELVPVNPFWADYAAHADGPFLSRHLAAAARNATDAMLALAVLDLPFEAGKHDTRFDGGRMTFTPGSRLVAFHEEVRPVGEPNGRLPVLVSQNVYRHGDRYREENGERLDKFVTGEFVVHTVYGVQVVVTNPGPSPQRLSVLLQVPVGSVPLGGVPATRSVLLDLQPYQTRAVDTLFYFPRPGRFAHFPAHVAKNEQPVAAAAPVTFDVLEKPTRADTESWEYVSQNGTPEQVLAFLARENVLALDLDRIAWRMADARFFEAATQLLADRHAYSPTLWSYALKHNAVPQANQYLLHADGLAAEVGGPIVSPLVTFDPVARHTFEHLEYRPLVNARAHTLGHRRQIVNDRLHAQYHAFLKQLTYRRALTADDELAAVYYLLLQDRVAEASERFAHVDAGQVATKLQYDYCAAYLAMFEDDPRRARDIAARYTGHPVDRWRNLFAAVVAHLDEAEGRGPKAVDPLDRDQQQAQLAATEPTFEVTADGRAVNLAWQNLGEVTVNYYLTDVELLFSTNPFVQAGGGRQFALIKPNATRVVKLPAGQARLSLPVPAEYARKNLLVEVTAAGRTQAVPVYANRMDVTLSEGYGQLRVTAAGTDKPLAKVYVKAYVRTADGRVKFHKDGYTDHRGRFDYATVSTPEPVPAARFALLVLGDEAGAVIREAAPPQQ
jgi:hypothetical protein